jgi:hypothetical protein
MGASCFYSIIDRQAPQARAAAVSVAELDPLQHPRTDVIQQETRYKPGFGTVEPCHIVACDGDRHGTDRWFVFNPQVVPAESNPMKPIANLDRVGEQGGCARFQVDYRPGGVRVAAHPFCWRVISGVAQKAETFCGPSMEDHGGIRDPSKAVVFDDNVFVCKVSGRKV